MKTQLIASLAVALAAICVTSCATSSKPQATAAPAAQKTIKPLNAKALLSKLKSGKVIHLKSCGCDPDPYISSKKVVDALTAISQGKATLANYPDILVNLIEGYPPLFGAHSPCKASPDLLNAVQTLIDAGANVDGLGYAPGGVSDVDVYVTPLHSAVSLGDTTLAKMLLDAGARPSKYTKVDDCDGDGDEYRYKTPLDYACTPDMEALLKQYGAKKGNVMMNSTMMRMRADQFGEEI